MKILLINPGQYMPAKINFPLNAFQPLGLGYLAAVLLDSGYEVMILDVLVEGYQYEVSKGKYRYAGLGHREIKRRIKDFGPDIVGITAPFTAQAKAVHEMAEIVKKTNLRVKVVIGGSYATTHTDIVLKDKNIDFAVQGEGELVFLELVKKIEKKSKSLRRIKGSLITSLDKYRVAWELLPMEKYFEAAYQIKASRSMSTFGKRWATLFTSRGCPYRCTFCVGHEVMGRKWRPRSPENVIAEMEYLIENYQVEHFDIEDDNFTLDKERAKKICDLIIKKKWSIKFSLPNGVRADTMDKQLVKKMAQAGCNLIVVAPESGDQKVVNHLMKKNINLNKIKQVVKWCQQYNLAVEAFFLIGMPGEKEENILKTIKYAKELRKLGAGECNFGVVVPHRGTEIYETVMKNDWFLPTAKKEDLVEGLMMGEPMFETPFLSADKIRTLLRKAVRVNSLIPFTRIKLIALIAIRTPRRFFKLTASELQKRLGLKEGILGA